MKPDAGAGGQAAGAVNECAGTDAAAANYLLSYSDSGEFLNYSVMFRNASDYQVDYHLRRVHPRRR
jgi:hypothetical protein